MDFTLRPLSLQRFSAVSIGLEIWKAKGVKQLRKLNKYKYRPFQRRYLVNKISEMFSQKVSKLPLPKILKNQVIDMLMIIGFQICKIHDELLEFDSKPDIDIYFELSNWTLGGTIDEWKVMKSVLDDEHFRYFESGYSAGCKFCNLRFDPRTCVRSNGNDETRSRSVEESDREIKAREYCTNRKVERVEFSTMLENNVEFTNISFERINVSEHSTRRKFWVNCLDEKRIGIVRDTYWRDTNRQSICCRELFFFLISNITTTEHQMAFFRRNAHIVLMQILKDLPRLELFTEAVELMKDFITHDDSFYMLFRTIAEMGTREFAAVFECDKLFEALWIGSPDSLKRKVIRMGHEMVLLVLSMDARSINLMLNYADDRGKRCIVECIKRTILKNWYKPWGKCESLAGFLRELMFNEVDINHLEKEASLVKVGLCTRLCG